MSTFEFRNAVFSDAVSIAELHTRSWQRHYRGMLEDTYLDTIVPTERLALWKKRLSEPVPDQWVLLALENNMLKGFLCAFLRHDTTYGVLLDNLHVDFGAQGQGIGTQLIRRLGQRMEEQNLKCMYLWVLQQNEQALAFYKALGGVPLETTMETGLGDVPIPKIRMGWVKGPG